jgi:hypothetical protein
VRFAMAIVWRAIASRHENFASNKMNVCALYCLAPQTLIFLA